MLCNGGASIMKIPTSSKSSVATGVTRPDVLRPGPPTQITGAAGDVADSIPGPLH
jgi:hypothetical protein